MSSSEILTAMDVLELDPSSKRNGLSRVSCCHYIWIKSPFAPDGTCSTTLALLSVRRKTMEFYFPVAFLGVVATNAAIMLLRWHLRTMFISTSSLNKSVNCSTKIAQHDQQYRRKTLPGSWAPIWRMRTKSAKGGWSRTDNSGFDRRLYLKPSVYEVWSKLKEAEGVV